MIMRAFVLCFIVIMVLYILTSGCGDNVSIPDATPDASNRRDAQICFTHQGEMCPDGEIH